MELAKSRRTKWIRVPIEIQTGNRYEVHTFIQDRIGRSREHGYPVTQLY
jgi:hypothetical protein